MSGFNLNMLICYQICITLNSWTPAHPHWSALQSSKWLLTFYFTKTKDDVCRMRGIVPVMLCLFCASICLSKLYTGRCTEPSLNEDEELRRYYGVFYSTSWKRHGPYVLAQKISLKFQKSSQTLSGMDCWFASVPHLLLVQFVTVHLPRSQAPAAWRRLR